MWKDPCEMFTQYEVAQTRLFLGNALGRNVEGVNSDFGRNFFQYG